MFGRSLIQSQLKKIYGITFMFISYWIVSFVCYEVTSLWSFVTNTPVNGDCVAALTLDSKIRRMMIDLAGAAVLLYKSAFLWQTIICIFVCSRLR